MRTLSAGQTAFLWTLAGRIVPAASAMASPARAQVLSLIDEAMSARPPAIQWQVGLFLTILRWAPVLRYLRTLDRLDPRRQDAVLGWAQDCPFQAVRSGFWGVRTLIYLGYYGRPDVGTDLAYTPSTNGNSVLHARPRR